MSAADGLSASDCSHQDIGASCRAAALLCRGTRRRLPRLFRQVSSTQTPRRREIFLSSPVPDYPSSAQVDSSRVGRRYSNMQVGRPIDDGFRQYSEPRDRSRVSVAPVPASGGYQRPVNPFQKLVQVLAPEDVCVSIGSGTVGVPCCALCGVLMRQTPSSNTVKACRVLCQGCRRSEVRRKESKATVEDLRPASPMAGDSIQTAFLSVGKPESVSSLARMPLDGRVHPTGGLCEDKKRWSVNNEVAGGVEIEESTSLSAGQFHPVHIADTIDAGLRSFRTLDVVSCFRTEARRGLRLFLKAVTSEAFHVWWALIVSLLLLPFVLTLAVVAGMGFLVLSTVLAVVSAMVYPLVYVNPKLYDMAMDS